ncbi:MAG TPA: hypothetical protein VGN36_00960 [Sphingorhabdus sp.]|jgi:hypothetical protein|nr:hypothetical protein [Sphingorhabdus sp.]
MTVSTKFLTMSSLPIVAGLIFATSLHAQETEPVIAPSAAAPSPPEVAQPVAPPPAVSTLPSANDTVAPQAAAEVEAERAERATERRTSKAAAAPVARAIPRDTRPVPEPVSEAVAPDAPIANVASDPVSEPVVETSMAEPIAASESAPVATDANDGVNEWLLGAGIIGALGLAGIALAMRRRRRSGDVVTTVAPTAYTPTTAAASKISEPKPVVTPTIATPAPDPFFAEHRRPVTAVAADPMFAARADDVRPVTDPLFAHKPEQAPITDPMFSRKIDAPPITDPMFAHRPEYAGETTSWSIYNRRNWAGNHADPQEMEPAE